MRQRARSQRSDIAPPNTSWRQDAVARACRSRPAAGGRASGARVARRTDVTTTATIVSVTVTKLVGIVPNASRKRELSGPDVTNAVVRDR